MKRMLALFLIALLLLPVGCAKVTQDKDLPLPELAPAASRALEAYNALQMEKQGYEYPTTQEDMTFYGYLDSTHALYFILGKEQCVNCVIVEKSFGNYTFHSGNEASPSDLALYVFDTETGKMSCFEDVAAQLDLSRAPEILPESMISFR